MVTLLLSASRRPGVQEAPAGGVWPRTGPVRGGLLTPFQVLFLVPSQSLPGPFPVPSRFLPGWGFQVAAGPYRAAMLAGLLAWLSPRPRSRVPSVAIGPF